ncbi:efflux RND transporter periplasmic adaptor subunit [Methylobacterium gossipiicola]|uniref:Multidrug efflux pump subunit AcrA (Membrane-fusion protein) n=1 Tax=Methylobacterium gossipiicola TaxID=582675 RepID=A0A1I2VXI1_9HYPH|nr:HlyD family efflux transporter periplasmic adaptor subunit [Methylobacterium gossipiicola]SFG93752.1 Multidrug efflux pump subunit AcrA (membrane-fusion protein) [Methylobacterium gossipiicola]
MLLVPMAALRALALACFLTLPALVFAHEGHDHGAEPPPAPVAAAPRAEAVSKRFELVAVVLGADLVFYLDDVATNAPVAGAGLAVSLEGQPRRKAVETAPGTYRLPLPWAKGSTHNDLLVGVTANGATDILSLDLDLDEAPAATASTGAATPTLAEILRRQNPLATAAGFLLGLAVLSTVRGRRTVPVLALLAVTATLVLGGTARAHEGHADGGHAAALPAAPLPAALTPGAPERARRLPDGSVFVPKSLQRLLALRTDRTALANVARVTELPGRIIADPNASGVVQSSVGGRLAPPPGGFPRLGTRVRRGDVLAVVTPPVQAVDVSDMRQRQGELDQQIAILMRRVDRFERLATTGAVARTQLDDARSELDGLRDRRAALDAVRREPEALVAPVDGVIAETGAVAGAMAAPGTVVYRIVDPGKLWVEALSFSALDEGSAATARLGDGASLTLAYRGAGLADRNQAVPVQFAITGETGGLRLGQFVTVLAPTGGPREGLALPRGGLVRHEATSLVYEHVSAERFIARAVRAEALDADRVLVADGLAAGRRVVVQGAELLDQIR